jgi:hypothetical protein
MWVKRTDADSDEQNEFVRSEKTRWQLRLFRVGAAVLVFLLVTLLPHSSKRTGGWYPPYVHIRGTHDLVEFIGLGLIVAVIAGLPVWDRLGSTSERKFTSKTSRSGAREMLCPKCEAAKWDDGVTKCSCGGEFVPLDTLKWVD